MTNFQRLFFPTPVHGDRGQKNLGYVSKSDRVAEFGVWLLDRLDDQTQVVSFLANKWHVEEVFNATRLAWQQWHILHEIDASGHQKRRRGLRRNQAVDALKKIEKLPRRLQEASAEESTIAQALALALRMSSDERIGKLSQEIDAELKNAAWAIANASHAAFHLRQTLEELEPTDQGGPSLQYRLIGNPYPVNALALSLSNCWSEAGKSVWGKEGAELKNLLEACCEAITGREDYSVSPLTMKLVREAVGEPDPRKKQK